jgi:hypothetical protein
VRRQQDHGIAPRLGRIELARDVVAILGDVGEGGREHRLHLGDTSAIVLAVHPEDVTDPEHGGSRSDLAQSAGHGHHP